MTLQTQNIFHNISLQLRDTCDALAPHFKKGCSDLAALVGIRHRYFFTRDKSIRLRYTMPVAVMVNTALLSLIIQTIPTSQARIFNSAQEIELATTLNTIQPAAGTGVSPQVIKMTDAKPEDTGSEQQSDVATNTKQPENLLIPASFYKAADTIKAEAEISGPVALKIKPGQTVSGQLQEMGVSGNEAYQVVKSLSKHYNPRNVRAGQEFKIELDPTKDENGQPLKSVSKMTMPLSPAKHIVVYRMDNGTFKSEAVEKKTTNKLTAQRATLKYSLYGSAAKAGIPDEVIAKMIKIFSWNVDFQRDIRSGDEIEILYEVKETDDGNVIGYGDIHYARLSTAQNDIALYRFKTRDGHTDYFDETGQSSRKTLIRTPVDGARISSGYGMRRHPILGYNKMHKGVDFAAPTGTPIYAAGDGVIEKAGRWGAYGKYIRIRHNSKLKTAYAHLHRIKSGMKPGTRVKQGQVIGTVGSTGRSTGPHLHYEVLINGKQVNPRGVNVPVGEQLKGKDLQKFKNEVRKHRMDFAASAKSEEYAELSSAQKQKSN